MIGYGSFEILVGDVLDKLRALPGEYFHCVVTSPPYWGLRNYKTDGQIGLEKTPDEYVCKMVDVFREVARVLRSDGTLWLNLGDTHRKKQLVGIPARVALALQADGWWWRHTVIWSKPSPMPESVRDRPTSSHEYLLILTKQGRYFWDAEAVKEPSHETSGWARQRAAGVNTWEYNNTTARVQATGQTTDGATFGEVGYRNLRDVWTIPTAPFSEAHFATYPPALVRPCVNAGTSAKGCCPKCGTPWRRVVKRYGYTKADRKGDGWNSDDPHRQQSETMNCHGGGHWPTRTIGWRPWCECGEWMEDGELGHYPPVPCRVLDPFCGSGTTLMVACQLGRDAVGIELNPDYATMARNRVAKAIKPGTYVDEAAAVELPLFDN